MTKIRNRKLKQALLDFVDHMETRLAQKERESYADWDEDHPTTLQLLVKIKDDATMIGQLRPYSSEVARKLAIDIANRAMIIWFRVPIKN